MDSGSNRRKLKSCSITFIVELCRMGVCLFCSRFVSFCDEVVLSIGSESGQLKPCTLWRNNNSP